MPALLSALGVEREDALDRFRKFDALTVAAETGSGKTLAYLLPYYEAAKVRASLRVEGRVSDDVGEVVVATSRDEVPFELQLPC